MGEIKDKEITDTAEKFVKANDELNKRILEAITEEEKGNG